MTNRTGAAFGLALLASLTACGDAGSTMQKGFEDGFKAQFVDNFTRSCQSSAGDSGLAAEKIAEVCKCAAETLIEKHEVGELTSMKPDDAMPVMKECAAKSGLSV